MQTRATGAKAFLHVVFFPYDTHPRPQIASCHLGNQTNLVQFGPTSSRAEVKKQRIKFVRVLFSKGLVFISKPRCGSTSIRRHLGPYISEKDGDFAVDVAETVEHFHPHATAPYVKLKLNELYPNHPKLTYFMTIRHPVDMLWSYYRFFMPDAESRYNFQPDWKENTTMEFEDWVQNGRVGMNSVWQELAPKWISTQNLSPLSLEAHAIDRSGKNHVNRIFELEQAEKLNKWLSARLERRKFPKFSFNFKNLKPLPHVNQAEGDSKDSRRLSEQSLNAIRKCFPPKAKYTRFDTNPDRTRQFAANPTP